MRVKNGVSLVGVQWQMFVAAIIVEGVYAKHTWECVITSGAEGKHTNETSLHYRGRALDFRVWDISPMERSDFTHEVRVALGRGYDVVMKPDHLHVEYDPRMEGV